MLQRATPTFFGVMFMMVSTTRNAEPNLEDILSKHDLRLSDMTSWCSYPVRVRMAALLVDWKLTGYYFGFSQLKLHAIQVDPDHESEEQRRLALLEAWAEGEGKKATYLRLAEVLYEHGRRDLVEHLCKMIRRVLRSDVQSKTPPKTRKGSKSNAAASMGSLTSNQHPVDISEDKVINLEWESDRQVAPQTMSRWADATVNINGTKVYFLPGATYARNILAYQTSDGSWSEFRSSPHTNCALTIIKDTLTTIGGGGFPYTNKVYSFSAEGTCGMWTEVLPPMPTKRQWTATLYTGTHVIVAGGWGSANVPLATVEVLSIKTQKWYTSARLPEPLFHASMTLCGDHVYILGGYDELKKPSATVYTCSLSDLLKSDNPAQNCSTYQSNVWKRLSDLPVTESTAVSLYDQLLAVGGRDSELQSASAVYKYSFISNSWEIISHMLIPRHLCFAAVISDDRVLVVGGENGRFATNSVEIATSSIEL